MKSEKLGVYIMNVTKECYRDLKLPWINKILLGNTGINNNTYLYIHHIKLLKIKVYDWTSYIELQNEIDIRLHT